MDVGPFGLSGFVASGTKEVLIALCVLIVILGALIWLTLFLLKGYDAIALIAIIAITVAAVRAAPGFFPAGQTWVEVIVQTTVVVGGVCATIIWEKRQH